MTISKGKSGKKPKYEIPDIGSLGVTAEDRSMERVLDFIVRGSLDSGVQDEAAEGINETLPANSSLYSSTVEPQVTPKIDAPSPQAGSGDKETRKKKSLDHIFSRTNQIGSASSQVAGEGFKEASDTVDINDAPVDAAITDQSVIQAVPMTTGSIGPQGEDQLSRPAEMPLEAPPSPVTEVFRDNSPLDVTESSAPDDSSLPAPSHDQSFQAFSTRFGQLLKDSPLKMCEVIFENTLAAGQTEYFTTTLELTTSVGLRQRQCYNLLNKLESLGFINRKPVEDNGRLIGITLSLNLNPFN